MAKYEDRRARVKVRGEGGVLRGEWWKDRGKGVTQGGVDSMELFGVMVDALEEALVESGARGVDCEEGGARWRLMMYADDVVLVAETQEFQGHPYRQTYHYWSIYPGRSPDSHFSVGTPHCYHMIPPQRRLTDRQ